MQKKKGISLIVLVITIIVMIILAGAIILKLNNSGIIEKASESVFKSNVQTYRTQLSTYIAEQKLEDATFKMEEFNASLDTTPSIADVIAAIKEEDKIKFEVIKGELIYVGENETEANWCKEIGLSEKEPTAEDIYNETYATEIALALEYGKFVDGVYSLNDPLAEIKKIALPWGTVKFDGNISCNEYLEDIIFPGTLREISGWMFDGASITNIELPEGYTTIQSNVFSYSCIQTITIPISVTTIQSDAFAHCFPTTVNYRGTEEQWNAIIIESGNDNLNGATINFNYND